METVPQPIVTKQARMQRGSIFAFRIAPRHQFRMLVGIGLVLGIVLISFHVYFLRRIQTHTIFQVTAVPDMSMPVVNQDKLGVVLARYNAKAAANAAALTATPPTGAEPSK